MTILIQIVQNAKTTYLGGLYLWNLKSAEMTIPAINAYILPLLICKKENLISHMWNFRLWELEPHSSGICACKTKIKKLYYFYCWLVRGYYIMIYSISSFYFLQVPPQMTESEYRRTDNTMFKSLNIPKRKSEATNRWSADNVMDKQFEDSKEVIRSRKSKNRQHNGQTFADTNWVIKIRKLKNRQI